MYTLIRLLKIIQSRCRSSGLCSMNSQIHIVNRNASLSAIFFCIFWTVPDWFRDLLYTFLSSIYCQPMICHIDSLDASQGNRCRWRSKEHRPNPILVSRHRLEARRRYTRFISTNCDQQIVHCKCLSSLSQSFF